MSDRKHPSSYRLSTEARELIDRLAAYLGISQAGVIEQAVRKLARAELPNVGQGEPSAQRRGKGKGK